MNQINAAGFRLMSNKCLKLRINTFITKTYLFPSNNDENKYKETGGGILDWYRAQKWPKQLQVTNPPKYKFLNVNDLIKGENVELVGKYVRYI